MCRVEVGRTLASRVGRFSTDLNIFIFHLLLSLFHYFSRFLKKKNYNSNHVLFTLLCHYVFIKTNFYPIIENRFVILRMFLGKIIRFSKLFKILLRYIWFVPTLQRRKAWFNWKNVSTSSLLLTSECKRKSVLINWILLLIFSFFFRSCLELDLIKFDQRWGGVFNSIEQYWFFLFTGSM